MSGELIRWALRWVGALLTAPALFFAGAAFLFALADSWGETEYLMSVGVANGAVLALAVFLMATPPAGYGTRRWYALSLLAALVIGAAVGGALVWRHYEVFRIRATPPRPAFLGQAG